MSEAPRSSAVRNVSIELVREASERPDGGMRKDDGAIGLRAAVAAAGAAGSAKKVDGRGGRWLADDAGDSGRMPSSAAVARVTVTAVEVVPTVGDGEGTRGGTVAIGVSGSCSFMSSEGSCSSDDRSLLLRSGAGERASRSG